MNPIKQRIAQFLIGEESASAEDFLALLGETQELVQAGAESDADALLYARKINNRLNVVGIVGKSLLQGPDLSRFLAAYFADSGGIDLHKVKIADYLYNDLKGRTEDACMVLKSEDRRWKAFRPLKNLDEVLAGAMDS